jgi:hypothetical protein
MKKNYQREKRLELRRKEQIMAKDQEKYMTWRKTRNAEVKLVDFKYNTMVKQN